MKKLSYIVGSENARELKGVLSDLTELHDRLAAILGDCEEWADEYGSEVKQEYGDGE